MRYRLLLEYEGTRYSGWQVQPNARTIQGELQRAVEAACGRAPRELGGAGRTDAGVHALGQVAHLEVETSLAPQALRQRVNDQLPPDIAVVRIEPARAGFHARHDALSRTYLYQICRRRTAFGKRLVWWIKDRLELEPMRQAALLFPGLRDFRSFAADPPGSQTRAQVHELVVHGEGDLLLVRIRASHFLWKMVRRVVGTLVEVGARRMRPAQVRELLEQPSDRPAAFTAPPSGLFLERVEYPGDPPEGALMPVLRVESDPLPRAR